MKKITTGLIITLSIILVAFLGWYFLLRDKSAPVGEVIRGLLPFGSGEDIQLPVDSSQQTVDSKESLIFDEFGKPTTNLFRVSDTPVAGAVVLTRDKQTIVRYVDRATGHIYDVNPLTMEKTKVTNQTLPKIYEAYFRPDGNAVLLRSLKDDSDVVENLLLTLTSPIATTVSTSSPQATNALYSVAAAVLRGDIGSVAVGAGNTLYYSLKDSTAIVSSAFNGTGVKTLLSSAFTDWRLRGTGNTLLIHSKASARVPGYAYSLSMSGTMSKILGPLNGLSAVPDSSGTWVFYSYLENSRVRSVAKNLRTSTVSDILPATLAEKCVWSVKKAGTLFCGSPINELTGNEPDNWYRGLTHFSDRLWLFDANTDIAQVLVEPKIKFGVDLDVVEPKLSPNEDYLIFINKTDLSLWALRLDQTAF